MVRVLLPPSSTASVVSAPLIVSVLMVMSAPSTIPAWLVGPLAEMKTLVVEPGTRTALVPLVWSVFQLLAVPLEAAQTLLLPESPPM